MTEPISTVALITQMIGIADKLLDKTPNYEQRKRDDYIELKREFNIYKDLPLEHRVNTYLLNLKKEIMAHIDEMVGQL